MSDILLPHKFCFRTAQDIRDSEFKTIRDAMIYNYGENCEEDIAIEMEEWDTNADDYEHVEDGHEIDESYGYYDAQVLSSRIIRRKSDGKFFKMVDHQESWNMDYISVGSYGDIYEVKPVVKTVFEKV